MFRALWLAAVAVLVPAAGLADGAKLCPYLITAPADGATAVPLDSAVVGLAGCAGLVPVFVDDMGKAVAADMQWTPGKFKLQPKAPLQPDRNYTVRFSTHQTCGSMDGMATFTTALRPGLRHVEFAGAAGDLHAATIYLSEPVANANDLADGSMWINAKIDGYSQAPQVQEGPKWATSYRLYYKNNAQKPASSARLTVTLRQGLKFASGAVLANDLELAMVPAELPFGWSVNGSRLACEDVAELGCGAGRTGVGGWSEALAAMLGIGALGWWRLGRGGTRRQAVGPVHR